MKTDFIFTVLVEEFGLIGAICVLLLYTIVLTYGLLVGIGCRNQFGRLLAAGLSMTLFYYVFINIGMVMGMMPVVGVPLPLISYGGSAILTWAIAFGLILSVASHRHVSLAPRGSGINLIFHTRFFQFAIPSQFVMLKITIIRGRKMKHIKAALVWALLGTSALSADDISAAVGKDYSYLDRLYKHLHSNPELSFKEHNTAARIADELRGVGFDVTEQVGRVGVVGVLKNGEGPTVLVRTDLDALPVTEQTGFSFASKAMGVNEAGDTVGVMHACGHDIHMTSFIGTARQLAQNKAKWKGTLVFIGQPAEETVGGAQAMLSDGLFERFPKPDYNIALHVSSSMASGTVGMTSGYALANVNSVDIAIKGVGGHGAYPHTTKDPIVLGAQIVTALQDACVPGNVTS